MPLVAFLWMIFCKLVKPYLVLLKNFKKKQKQTEHFDLKFLKKKIKKVTHPHHDPLIRTSVTHVCFYVI